MKRILCTWITVLALVSAWGTPVAAQSPGDDWDVYVAPYLMGAAESGTAVLHGHEVAIDVAAADIFENLQFGAMGIILARKGNWGVGADVIWMALGTTVRETNVDFNQGAFAFYGLRRLGAAADATFGLRVNTLQGEFTFKTIDETVSQDKTWVDPIVGLSLHSPLDRAVQFRVYTEIAGFGLGSDFGWQIFPTIGFRLGSTFSLEFGYRWLDLDYTEGDGNERFTWDVLAQGPVAGFGFRF